MAERPLPTGTVAFLFTDIEGSTRRWDAHGPAMGIAVARHDALLRAAIGARDGYVFKTIGDAFCAAFPRAEDALAAALAAQRALETEDWGETGPIRARMAVHVGPAEARGGDYFGPAVERAGRLLSAGHGGQVLLSASAAELARSGLVGGASLHDLGEHRLKDLIRPERIFQLVAPDLPADFPALTTVGGRPNNLPPQPTPLVGREAELALVGERLGRPAARLVTLTGPGGTGKTRLALQVAADAIDDFPHGVWFVELEAATDEEAVVAAVARALGVREAAGLALRETLLAYLAPKRLLLVLDNFEQVAHAAPVVASLLKAAPGVTALVTSRVRLGIQGEQVLDVPPLGLPPEGRAAGPEAVGRSEAGRLFVERAQAAKGGFALTADNAAAVAQICRDLDGLPLAIELAAARVKLLPPEALLARLADRLGLLVGGARDASTRQQTLRGAIAWSHDLLPPAERILFARLAVFAGGWSFEAAEAVANPGAELDLFAALAALVDHSLVRQEETAEGDARFAMLATIREFAREQLDAAGGGEAELTRMLHAEHFLANAERAEPELTGPDQARWLERLETEHDNLRAALAWFSESGDPEDQLRFAAALWRFWDIHGHLTEGRGWLERALERANGAIPHARAKALQGAGVIASTQGDMDHAIARLEAALALSRAVDDDTGIARSTVHLGMIAYSQGDFDLAVANVEQALAHYRASGDDRGVAIALHVLSVIALDTGDDVRADELGAESLRLWRMLGEESGITQLVHHQGNLAFHRKDFAAAADLFSESLSLSRRTGDARLANWALAMLGRVHGEIGRLDEAMAYLDEALSAAQELGHKSHAAFALYGMAYVAKARGDHAEARRRFGESLALYQDIGERVGFGECLEGLAAVCCATGLAFEGTLLLAAAEALRASLGMPLPTLLIDEHARSVAAARAALGEATFADVWATGYVMSPEQAAAQVSALA